MEKNNEIDKINFILDKKYLCKDQSKIVEVNFDSKGKPFCMERCVVGASSLSYSIYRFDPNDNNFFPYFSDVKDLKKICDYIIFVEDSKRLFIFLVELKKKSGSPERQLDMSVDFVNFILARAKSINCEINKDISFRKLGIKDSQTKKRETAFYRNFSYNKNSYSLIQSKSDLRLRFLMDAPIN